MTAPDPRLEEIEGRLSKATPGPWEARGLAYNTTVGKVGEYRNLAHLGDPLDREAWRNAEFIATAPADVAYLLAELRKAQDKLARVEGLADMWTKRGEHDMAYSKTIPDEDIAMAILTEGASMVENARHIRNALRAAVADATGGGDS